MKRAELHQAILNTNGKVFNVVFTKKDGSQRVMTCRTKVKKHVVGGERLYDRQATDDNPIVGVYEMVGTSGAENYKCVYINTIKQFNGQPIED